MIKALADNPEHIQLLCSRLELGQAVGPVERVFGGFHHRMWRLETALSAYAVKQLSPDTDCSDEQTIACFNRTESGAEKFLRCGIPAVVARRSPNGYLQVLDGTGYLVYPWVDAVALDKNAISSSQAQCVAQIMARMHRATIDIPGLSHAVFDTHSKEKIEALLDWAMQRNVRDARELQSRLPSMLEVVDLQPESIAVLQRCQVVSHGDLDHKNVLWTREGEPLLIDWESVRWLNPTYEVILEALDWSGITGNFSRQAFAAFLSAYRQAGGVIDSQAVNASINCVFGDWLNWLMYNVGRAMDLGSSDERGVGSEQVDLAFTTLLRLERQLPALLTIAQEQSSGEVIYV